MSDKRPHIRIDGRQASYNYTRPKGGGGGEYELPARDRIPHAQQLRESLLKAQDDARNSGLRSDEPRTITYDLQPNGLEVVESLERIGSRIELLNVVKRPNGVRATVRVPADKFHVIDNIFKRYETEEKDGKPKAQRLVETIDGLRLSRFQDYWTDVAPLPDPGDQVWWEVWLYHPAGRTAEEVRDGFVADARAAGLDAKPVFSRFPERVVVLAFGALAQWATQPRLLLLVAELRRAKTLAGKYVELPAKEQGEAVDELLSRTIEPDEDAPAVCILDTGINRNHPLIEIALDDEDAQAVVEEWGPDDNDLHHGHGTTMAGIALYGPLEEALGSEGDIVLRHRLESVKIIPNVGENDPELYGQFTQDAVALAEIKAPNRKRAVSMAVTADALDGGFPSSWSAALDQLAADTELTGEAKLMCVSAGNLRDEIHGDGFGYPMTAEGCGIEDPGQSFNAITVGAMTEKVVIEDPDLAYLNPIAPTGDLSPTSRTSIPWSEDERKWAIKPDVVEEGGNWAEAHDGTRDSPDDLGLVSTIAHPAGRLFAITRDTSPATAQVARVAANVWSEYSDLWPETVRGLVVHSARWTPAMVERYPGGTKAAIQERLRCYGYGRPSLDRARHSAGSAATMIFEGALQPYALNHDNNKVVTNEMHLHPLPWPVEVLANLGANRVRVRVTLSYFVEPSPGRRGWTRRHRYASHLLRFRMIRSTEKVETFIKRISTTAIEDDGSSAVEADALPWVVGVDGRTRGSIHSDWFEASGADVANCGFVAVHPVTGWWQERKHLERYESKARYSLIVSLETDVEDIDLYQEIEALAVLEAALPVPI